MIFLHYRPIISLIIALLSLNKFALAEPFIVLSYSTENQYYEGDGKNEFSLNPDHSAEYKVKKGDSLNSILKEYYSGSGLDRRFIQLSIVISNPHAFAKNNPNFLFSGKKIYLPGKSDIEKLVIGQEINNTSYGQNNTSRYQNIYFFGG